MKLTKLIAFVSLSLLLGFSYGCRKKNDTAMELATKPYHCYNETMDADEILVDYGGSCGTSSGAVSMTSDCGQATNTAKITSDVPSTYNFTVTSCTRTSSSSYYTYTMNLSGGGYIQVMTLTTVAFNTDLTVMSLPSANDECSVDFYMSPYSGSCSGGQVRIKYDGTNYALNLCGATWFAGFNYGDINAFANVN